MATPRIRYTTTSDGVQIAYFATGRGLPLVAMSGFPFSHVRREWELPLLLSLVIRAAAESFRLVRFDFRGTGKSTRGVTNLSLDALVSDLEAVVGATGLDKFALWAHSESGPVAVKYAIKHPNQVSQLVLHNSYAQASDALGAKEARAFITLLEDDWIGATETAAHLLYSWSDENASTLAEFYRQCVTQAGAIAAVEALKKIDVSPLLRKVTVPTMVGCWSESVYPAPDLSKDLAASIPGAQVVITQSWLRDVLVPIGRFLGADVDVTAFGPTEDSMIKPKVKFIFLCHATEDKSHVEEVRHRLRRAKHESWYAPDSLLGGAYWKDRIDAALEEADHVLIFLSARSISKRGYFQREVKYAFDVLEQHPDGARYIIPILLEDCNVPRRFKDIHWIRLYEKNGMQELLKAVSS